jgi:small-conductance mechanosensitive channel
LVGVLGLALQEQNREEPAEVAVTADSPPDVLVTMTLNAEDASIAQLDAQERVREALRRAGIEGYAKDVAIETDS